ncbi:hypothetical protein BSKO_05370 [Bryopsis sp. KO-2023]|nr:hypothetical protein BSKO_05370 [Bryopsis sp. KO-2023]
MCCTNDFDQKALLRGSACTPAMELHPSRSIRGEDPICASEEFMMYCFKVAPCCKQYCHDWWACPFAHEGEKARRRDPRTFKYASVACPSVKQGKHCNRGELCPGTHNVFEYWLHPSRFRTQFCGRGIHCSQPFCFFAHSMAELRHPSGETGDSPTHAGSKAPTASGHQLGELDTLKSRSPLLKMGMGKDVSPIEILSIPSVMPHNAKHHRVRSAAEIQPFTQLLRTPPRPNTKSLSVDWTSKPFLQDLDRQMDLNSRILTHSLTDGGCFGNEGGGDAYQSMAATAERLLRMLDESGAST